MKSVVFHGIRDVRFQDSPVPVPGEGEVRLKVSLAGICSTDLHIVKGHFPVRPPRILGHELVGVVDAVGVGVSEDWTGQMCGVRPARFCGVCGPCRQGSPELCENFESLGNTHEGGFAEYTLARVDQLVPLRDIPMEDGLWLEPLACILQALDQIAPLDTEQPVLVIGAGTLGSLMVMTLQVAGMAKIGVIDPNPEKVEQALGLGASAGWAVPRSGLAPMVEKELNRWAPGGIRVLIDTTGAPAAIERAVAWAGAKAQILLFGVSDPTAAISIHPTDLFSKELVIRASSGMTPDSFDKAYKLLESKRIRPSSLNAAVVGLEAVPKLLTSEHSPHAGKILVQP